MRDAGSRKVTHRAIQRYAAAARQVFPLLCPVREKEWDPDWDSQILYSKSGLAEEDCIFRTVDEEGIEELWYFTEYDIEKLHLQLVRMCPPSRAGKLNIRLRDTGPSACEAEISYTFVSLDEEGDRFLADYTKARFTEFMKAWEKALGHYLHTGTRVATLEY